MHSLNDNSKLDLYHMGRSHFFKNHSNKLNFQNPSICRLTSTNLAHPPKIFSKFKTWILAAISSNTLHTQIIKILNTIVSSDSCLTGSLSRSSSPEPARTRSPEGLPYRCIPRETGSGCTWAAARTCLAKARAHLAKRHAAHHAAARLGATWTKRWKSIN